VLKALQLSLFPQIASHKIEEPAHGHANPQDKQEFQQVQLETLQGNFPSTGQLKQSGIPFFQANDLHKGKFKRNHHAKKAEKIQEQQRGHAKASDKTRLLTQQVHQKNQDRAAQHGHPEAKNGNGHLPSVLVFV